MSRDIPAGWGKISSPSLLLVLQLLLIFPRYLLHFLFIKHNLGKKECGEPSLAWRQQASFQRNLAN